MECLNDRWRAEDPGLLPGCPIGVLKCQKGMRSPGLGFCWRKEAGIWRWPHCAPHWLDHVWSAGLSGTKRKASSWQTPRSIAPASSSHCPTLGMVSSDPELIWSEADGRYLPSLLPRSTLISSWEPLLHHSLPYMVRRPTLSRRNVYMTCFWGFLLEFLGNISSSSAEFEAGRKSLKAARKLPLLPCFMETSAWEEYELRAERESHLGAVVSEAGVTLSISISELTWTNKFPLCLRTGWVRCLPFPAKKS